MRTHRGANAGGAPLQARAARVRHAPTATAAQARSGRITTRPSVERRNSAPIPWTRRDLAGHDLGRGSVGDDAALVQDHQPVAVLAGEVQVVDGDADERACAGDEGGEPVEDLHLVADVERARRLVEHGLSGPQLPTCPLAMLWPPSSSTSAPHIVSP